MKKTSKSTDLLVFIIYRFGLIGQKVCVKTLITLDIY